MLKTILTRALIALCLLAQSLRAEEQSIITALSSTTLTGYVDTSASWWMGGGGIIVIWPGEIPDRPPVVLTPVPSPGLDTEPLSFLPINDGFANAISVDIGRISLPSNLASATLEPGEPSIPDQSGSIWFRWPIAKSGLARMSVNELLPYPDPSALSYAPALSDEPIFYPWGGISYDGSEGENDGGAGVIVVTVQPPPPIYRRFSFAVYRGDSLQNLTLLARGSEFELQAQAGETLWISFETFELNGGTFTVGSFPQGFSLDLTAPPSNDNFDSALTVTDTSGGSFAGRLIGATREVGEPDLGANFSGGSVWFGLTASMHGPITLNASSDLPIAVYTGSKENLQLVAKRQTTLTFPGEPGRRYHIAIYAGPSAIRSFQISYTAPRYRLYTTTVNDLMPAGQQPHFYGLRGSTLLLYAKSATGWDCVEIEPIVNFATDLLIIPNAVDGQLRVITIDETLPAPHIQLRPARGVLVPDVIGYPGQTCAISYSTDLLNWSAPQVHTLTSTPLSLTAISPSARTHFFRVTQSLPEPTTPQGVFQPQPPPPPADGGGSGIVIQHIAVIMRGSDWGPRRDIPPPPGF